MLDFKNIEIGDKKIIESYLEDCGCLSCTSNFSTMFIWGRSYNSKWAISNGRLLIISETPERLVAYPPFGKGDLKASIDELLHYIKATGKQFSFYGVEEKIAAEITAACDGFEVIERRDFFDYIYKASDLKELKGKDYHGKKGHFNKFMRSYDYEYKAIEDGDLADCMAINREWCLQNGLCSEKSTQNELCAVKGCLENFKALGAFGGIIRVSGKPVAFTIATRLRPACNTIDVHFEKAVSGYDGLYAAINNLFVNTLPEDILYVNREEDLGLEGLRKAKLSYHPEILLKKYELKFKG